MLFNEGRNNNRRWDIGIEGRVLAIPGRHWPGMGVFSGTCDGRQVAVGVDPLPMGYRLRFGGGDAAGAAEDRLLSVLEAPRPLPVVEVAEGVVDPRVILGLEAAAEDDMDARPSHHDEPHDHDHDDGWLCDGRSAGLRRVVLHRSFQLV